VNAKTIAWTVVGTCASISAMAQTGSPVTLYGRAYVVFESVEAKGGTAPVARRNRVSDRNSILGMRGSEDLGGGLKAFMQLETLFPADASTTSFANRNSGVGLQGGWGSVIIGRWDTPFKVAHAAVVDPFGDLALPDITGAALNQGNFSRREPNVVQYWSPKWRGFSVRAHYSANEGKTATVDPSVYSASFVYASANLYAAYAWERHEDQSRTTAAAGIDEEGSAVSASYKFGSLKLSGQYGRYKRTNTSTQRSYAAGLQWGFGKHVLLAAYQNSKDGGPTTAAQPKCDLWGVGYRYDVTKRTFLVAEYASVDNEAGSLCNFGTSPLPIAAGQDPRGFGIGVRHIF
jgi:predicted porin